MPAEKLHPALEAVIGMLRTNMEHWPERIYVKDSQRRFVYLNNSAKDAIHAHSGIPRDEILGKSDEDIFDPPHAKDAGDAELILLNKQDADNRIVREEFETWKRDKAVQMVYSCKSGVLSDGVCVGILGMTRPLRVAERSEFLKSLISAGDNCFSTVTQDPDRGDDAGFWKAELETIEGKKRAISVYLDPKFKLLHPGENFAERMNAVNKRDKKVVARFLRRAIKGNPGEHFSAEYRLRQEGNGDSRWVRGDAFIFCVDQRTILIISHRWIDAPTANELISQAILNAFPGYVFVKDKKRQFRFANENLVKAAGQTEMNDMIGCKDADFFKNPDQLRMFEVGDAAILDRNQESYVSLDESLDTKFGMDERKVKSENLITIKMPIAADAFAQASQPPGKGRRNHTASNEHYMLGISLVGSAEWNDIRDWKRIGQAIWKHSRAAMYLKDKNGKYEEVNEDFCEIVELKANQIKGKQARIVFKHFPQQEYNQKGLIEEIESQDQLLLDQKVNQIGPVYRVIKLPNGRSQLRLTSKYLLKDEYDKPWRILGISRDISEMLRQRAVMTSLEESMPVMRGGIKALSSTVFPGIKLSEAVILFCDIRRFSTAAATLTKDEEVLVDLIKGLFQIVAEESMERNFEFHFLGDGAMIVGLGRDHWNAEISNCARNMAILALRIQSRYQRLRTKWYEKAEHRKILVRKYSLNLGTGIHAAKVQAGFLQFEGRVDFNVFGDPVVIAQRLESAAGKSGDEILVSQAVYDYVSGSGDDNSEFIFGLRQIVQTKEEDFFAYPLRSAIPRYS